MESHEPDYSSAPPRPSIWRIALKMLLIALALPTGMMAFMAYVLAHDNPDRVNNDAVVLSYVLGTISVVALSLGIIIRKHGARKS